MPRLHGGYRERHMFNHYDALFLGSPDEVAKILRPSTTLFGDANVGNLGSTSIQIAHTLSCDQTDVIFNMYARTNIPACPELEVFTNSAIATLIVGEKPMRQLSLYDLLRRSERDDMPGSTEPGLARAEANEAIATLAETLYNQHELDATLGTTYLTAASAIQNKWRTIAFTAYYALHTARRPVIVPVRQKVAVRVNLFGNPEHPALMKALRHYYGPDRLPGTPGIWIHLAGMSTRDVP